MGPEVKSETEFLHLVWVLLLAARSSSHQNCKFLRLADILTLAPVSPSLLVQHSTLPHIKSKESTMPEDNRAGPLNLPLWSPDSILAQI